MSFETQITGHEEEYVYADKAAGSEARECIKGDDRSYRDCPESIAILVKMRIAKSKAAQSWTAPPL